MPLPCQPGNQLRKHSETLMTPPDPAFVLNSSTDDYYFAPVTGLLSIIHRLMKISAVSAMQDSGASLAWLSASLLLTSQTVRESVVAILKVPHFVSNARQ